MRCRVSGETPTQLRTVVAGFARIRTFAAPPLKSCDFSYNRVPLFSE